MLLAVAKDTLEGPDAIRDEVVRFEQVEILRWSQSKLRP